MKIKHWIFYGIFVCIIIFMPAARIKADFVYEATQTDGSDKDNSVENQLNIFEKSVQPYLAASNIMKQGKCGKWITWELDDSGTLYLKGAGQMDNYKSVNGTGNQPWSSYLAISGKEK